MIHKNEGFDCPCSPALLVVCPDCDGDGCWKCGFIATDGSGKVEGLVEIDRSEAENIEVPIIIVHNNVDEKSDFLLTLIPTKETK